VDCGGSAFCEWVAKKINVSSPGAAPPIAPRVYWRIDRVGYLKYYNTVEFVQNFLCIKIFFRGKTWISLATLMDILNQLNFHWKRFRHTL